MYPGDIHKTAFCPGPGMGLYQFKQMPFGLTGAPGSFQRLMDKVMRGLPFVTTYIDDVLVHSKNMKDHKSHLQQVFHRLSEAGLTLRGRKCTIAVSQVNYLGHQFTKSGLIPDNSKVQAVNNWPAPTDASSLRKFLGLASYYRRYIAQFSTIAAPLTNLTHKGVTYEWTASCDTAFKQLKCALSNAPVLAYPDVSINANPFVLQTDASAYGLGAVLEQNNHVIAYASRTLSKSEQNYSVIQRECLAIVYALKQFRHYLLGRKFHLVTDHAPLQWLGSQKMEGMLQRWTIAIQEFDFDIVYRKGALNTNADALSRREQPVTEVAALTMTSISLDQLRESQQSDPTITQIYNTLMAGSVPPSGRQWRCPPLHRYKQLWSQLHLVSGVVCRRYHPSSSANMVTVPLLPPNLQIDALRRCHDDPVGGHLGYEKSLHKLHQEAFWVSMSRDVEQYCRECVKCNESKPPAPIRAPMTSIPIGRPWQMVAIDVLEVPVSSNNNRYLLVLQDYFTKWVEVVPMPDQTAARIVSAVTKIFCSLGMPAVLHSDQGRNFESLLLRETLKAFGTSKSHTTAYHPQGDGMVERFNRSLLQMLRSYVQVKQEWEMYLPLVLYAYRTAIHSSTGYSPFELMYGRPPKPIPFEQLNSFDTASYPSHLQAKLAEMCDFVEANLVESASRQRINYNKHSLTRHFTVGDHVWLSVPTARKLDPRWDGKWTITAVKRPLVMEISNGTTSKVVHVNRLRHRLQPSPSDTTVLHNDQTRTWRPPEVDHYIDNSPEPISRRYPVRTRRPPLRYIEQPT